MKMKISESRIQSGFFKIIETLNYFNYSIFPVAINNATGKNNIVASIINKRNGVVAGFPDVMVLDLRNEKKLPFFIEFKTKTGKQSESQKHMELFLKNAGYEYIIARSPEEALTQTKFYFNL